MAKKRNSRKPEKERNAALERIDLLFQLASQVFRKSPALANRYVSMARKVAMKTKVRIRPELKRKFCKHCYSYLRPNINARVRLTKGHVTYFCKKCKKFMRFPYKKKRSKSGKARPRR